MKTDHDLKTQIKLRFDVEGSTEPVTLTVQSCQISLPDLRALADRLWGIDVCFFDPEPVGMDTLKNPTEFPIRLVADQPSLESLLEAVREDQSYVAKVISDRRISALHNAGLGLDFRTGEITGLSLDKADGNNIASVVSNGTNTQESPAPTQQPPPANDE